MKVWEAMMPLPRGRQFLCAAGRRGEQLGERQCPARYRSPGSTRQAAQASTGVSRARHKRELILQKMPLH